MAARIDAYVDTSAFIAFMDASDTYHALFRAMVEDMPFLDVRTVGPVDLKGAASLLRRFREQDLTLADAVGLHVMHNEGAASCWSTDRHLGLTGTPLAIHSV